MYYKIELARVPPLNEIVNHSNRVVIFFTIHAERLFELIKETTTVSFHLWNKLSI